MEAGYDYLLLRGRLRRRLFKYSGFFLILLGALLLAVGGAYYVYAANARVDLASLNVNLPGATDSLAKTETDQPSIPLEPAAPGTGRLGLRPVPPAIAIGSQQLYPGEALLASAWSDPLAFEPPSYRERVLLQGFVPVEFGQGPPLGSRPAATRIIVPSIGIDSTVKELEILDLGSSRAYESPAYTVGHIPETANAGEAGSSWFFGHTESPTSGEGSVFFNLQKVPQRLRSGEAVFIITDNGLDRFLYRATYSQVVHHSEMRLYDTGQATIHLVSCVPRLVYDHRLIITGELVAQKSKS